MKAKAQCVVLLSVLIVLLQALSTLQSAVPQNYTSEVLRLAKAAQIKAYLNEEKPPCENFYKFACGKWKRLQPTSSGVKKTAYLDQLQKLYVRKSAQMLEDDRKLDTAVDVMLKDFYESCRNKDAIQQLGIEPILRTVEMKGGWPKITSAVWYEYEYDWLKVVAELRRKLGVDILVGMEVIPDIEDKDTHRIKVGAPQLDLTSRDAYLSDDYEMAREEYKQGIANKLRTYFADMPDEWAKEVAEQVLYVEQQLSKGLPDNPKLTLKQTVRQRYAADLKAAYGSYVDLSRYLNMIFNQTIYVQVYEAPEDYLSNLVEVIKQTPKLTIANYTMWRVLDTFDYVGDINRNSNDNWCVEKISEYFPHQLEAMFYRNYNNRIQLINELNNVWSDIKKAFHDELQSSNKLNWITLATRQKAILKLDGMELNFIVHDQEDFEKQMYGLVLRKDKYYQNLISILQWHTQHKLATLVEKPQSRDAEINVPKYELSTNKIQIPVTFLQARFFWDDAYPNALKYSTLGFLLAQEMIHGFDAIGRKYDKHGYQRGWWDTVSEYAFDERANCFSKQYANYKFQGKEVSDPKTLETSIADNGGLSVAYLAYQKWWSNAADNELKIEESLPLLNYTQTQLFFIGFAQLWCADYHDSMDNFNELPERLRVIGALANFNEFAKEFQCEIGGKMNPTKKCAIY